MWKTPKKQPNSRAKGLRKLRQVLWLPFVTVLGGAVAAYTATASNNLFESNKGRVDFSDLVVQESQISDHDGAGELHLRKGVEP